MNMLAREAVPPLSSLPDGGEVDRVAQVFSTLANSIRLAIFCRIIEREWSVNELADDIGLSQSALSQHLRKLRDAKVVKTRRDRQVVYYRCEDTTVMTLLSQTGLIRAGNLSSDTHVTPTGAQV